ncbi:car [Symbiodinium sp. CCMP2592]|nr:car [Symbiodinium sp. CCMP2592]
MTADGWAARQQELVNIEFQEEKRQVEERLRHWPVEKLVAEGLALSNLQVKRDGEFFGDPLIEFSFPSAQPHDFQSGDWLLASKSSKHPLLPGALSAQVVDVQPTKILCAMPEWRLDRGVNYVTFRRISEALSSFGGNGVPGDVRAILLGHDDLEERNAMEDLSLQLPSEIPLDDSQHEARGACIREGVAFIPELPRIVNSGNSAG